MTASPILTPADQQAQPIALTEWLKRRRPPLPDFVSSLDALPSTLSVLVQRALPPGQPVAGALVLPAEYYARKASGWEWVPERTLVFFNSTVLLALAASSERSAQVTVLDARSLLYARSSLVLLYGLLEFKADCGGQAGEVQVEYNSVVWETFRSLVTGFVACACGQKPPGPQPPAAASNAQLLKSLPYKFANGLQYNGLRPGERLQFAVFQPEIRQGHWILSRQRTPNTVLALTDQKVVIIEETVSSALHTQPSKGEHGWIFTYMPRDRVVDIVVTPAAQLAELKVRLEWGSAKDERTILLDPQIADQWRRAWLGA